MLIFSFFVQKSRVNNLAMVESITWPFFCQNFAQKDGQVIDSTFFTLFLLKLVFFQKSHSPCRKKNIFEKQKKTQQKKYKKADGQVINFWWPSYQPYSIYAVYMLMQACCVTGVCFIGLLIFAIFGPFVFLVRFPFFPLVLGSSVSKWWCCWSFSCVFCFFFLFSLFPSYVTKKDQTSKATNITTAPTTIAKSNKKQIRPNDTPQEAPKKADRELTSSAPQLRRGPGINFWIWHLRLKQTEFPSFRKQNFLFLKPLFW